MIISRSSRSQVFCRKVFLKILQNSQKNICARSEGCNFIKKETLVQVFFYRIPLAAASESMEVNPVPPSISDEQLELNICNTLSLTGHQVKPDDLQACHHFKEKESVIVEFKGTVMQIEKALINDRYVFQKYPENFSFQLILILPKLTREIWSFLQKQNSFYCLLCL